MNMKKLTAAVLSLLCLTLTACGKTADDMQEHLTEKNATTITEITETEKVSVTSESEITEMLTKTETITEKNFETTSGANEVPDEELDFWAWSNVADGYIITEPADALTISKLYPLICKAFDYMSGSYKDFYFRDENVYEAIEEYAEQEGEKYSEVFTWHLIDQIPKPDEDDIERGKYVYSLGYLDEAGNGYGGDRGVDLSYAISDWQIEVISDTEVQLIHQAFYRALPDLTDDEPVYFKDHKLLNQADDSIHQMRTAENRTERLETYYYTLLWEDGHWKFDNFSLWI